MRKFVVALVVLLGAIFILGRMTEMQTIAETLRRGDWRFLLLGLGLETVWFLNIATSYRFLYRALDMEERLDRLVLLSSAATFVNVIAPTAGMGGMAVFISDARQRGFSSARVTVAGVLFVLFDYAGFFIILALGLIVLFRRNNLGVGELTASAILLAIASFLVVLIILGMRSAGALARLLAWIVRQVNRGLQPFIHRQYLSETRAHSFAHDMAGGLQTLRRNPKNLILPLLLALTSKILLLSVLTLMFIAFKVPLTVGTLVAGFSIGYLFLIVSPTPAGIGVVEGALTLALRSLYVPLGAAAVIALAYRGITFWVPLLVGMLSFRWLSHSNHTLPQNIARLETDTPLDDVQE